ncbi:hypothetical protein [Nocardia sp. bgisy134]|uniref:hypothetical protein n=1 Tax=unclassified Nocardia TaxID=2637762 RepID=UPI003D71EF80
MSAGSGGTPLGIRHIRYFHGCYSLGDDQLWGVTRHRKGGDHSLAVLKSILGARPDGADLCNPGQPLGEQDTSNPFPGNGK